MAFHLQSLPTSGHGTYDSLRDAQADADAHPDEWQDIRDLDTGQRWVRVTGGEWSVVDAAAAAAPSPATSE